MEEIDIRRIGGVCGSVASWVCGNHPEYKDTPIHVVQARAGLFAGMLGVPTRDWPIVHSATAESIRDPWLTTESDVVRVTQLAASVGLEDLNRDLATFLYASEQELEALDREQGWGLQTALAELEGFDQRPIDQLSDEFLGKHFPDLFPELVNEPATDSRTEKSTEPAEAPLRPGSFYFIGLSQREAATSPHLMRFWVQLGGAFDRDVLGDRQAFKAAKRRCKAIYRENPNAPQFKIYASDFLHEDVPDLTYSDYTGLRRP
jgi:hypothetical protein